MGYLSLVGYVGTIVLANWAIQTFGLVPVGLGLLAPAGVSFAGLAFTLRDLVQDSLGRRWTVAAIGGGARARDGLGRRDGPGARSVEARADPAWPRRPQCPDRDGGHLVRCSHAPSAAASCTRAASVSLRMLPRRTDVPIAAGIKAALAWPTVELACTVYACPQHREAFRRAAKTMMSEVALGDDVATREVAD